MRRGRLRGDHRGRPARYAEKSARQDFGDIVVSCAASDRYEVGTVLRRMSRARRLGDDVALTGLLATGQLIEHRYPHAGWLAAAAWDLRGAVSFYDALYVALAAKLRLPLLTADAKLSNA